MYYDKLVSKMTVRRFGFEAALFLLTQAPARNHSLICALQNKEAENSVFNVVVPRGVRTVQCLFSE